MKEAAESPDKPLVSVVVPVYNEEESLRELFRQLVEVLDGGNARFELLFVDDGSHDRSLAIMRELRAADDRVKLLSFTRNFGHQIAITAGMDHAAGDAVIVIDADLQDDPRVILDMIAKWQEGYDVVYAVREAREDSFFKRVTAAGFYRLLRRLTNIAIPLDVGDFRLMSRRALAQLMQLRERHRFVRGLVSWLGYRQTGVPFHRRARFAGTTKYPFRKMLKFAFDGITSFSFVPLQFATYFGFLVSIASFMAAGFVVFARLMYGFPVQGWASLMVAVLFLGGVQLIALGIVGEYVGRIYDEVKARPLYLVAEAAGLDNKVSGMW